MLTDRCRPCSRRAVVALLLALLTPAAYGAEAREWQFAVHFDGKRIGSHTFEVIGDGHATRVHSRAAFDFKVLFVPVYRYRHHVNELWQDGCLTALSAATDANGDRSVVRTSARPEGLLLTRHQGGQQTDLLEGPCAATFAYWDRSHLQRQRLINTQTGEALPSALSFEGADTVNGTPARRYRLDAGTLPPIHVWYDRDGGWLALRTERDGGVLTYTLEHTARRTVSGVEQHAGVEDPVGI